MVMTRKSLGRVTPRMYLEVGSIVNEKGGELDKNKSEGVGFSK